MGDLADEAINDAVTYDGENPYRKAPMAKVTRSKLERRRDKPPPPRMKAVDLESTVLPTEYEEPVNDINAHSFLIHGEKKIGKTTLALQGGKVLLLQCDPPQRSYKRLEIVISAWAQFRKILKKLEDQAAAGTLAYDRVVVDRADLWFNLCQDYVCEKLAIDHPSEEDWGKGWSAVRKEFTAVVDRLLRLPCGVWLLCHSGWKEVETRDGGEAQKLLPNLTATAEGVLNGKVDVWAAYDYSGEKRVLIVVGDERTGAGHRLNDEGFEHFRTPKGREVREILMGDSPKEAYQNLLKAYNNEQTYTRVSDPGKEKDKTEKKRNKKRRDEVVR